MKKSTIYGAGMITGGILITGAIMLNELAVRSAGIYDSDPPVPRVMHLDLPQQSDVVLVQTPDGSYVPIRRYLKKHVSEENRAVQKALIERMIEAERDPIVKE